MTTIYCSKMTEIPEKVKCRRSSGDCRLWFLGIGDSTSVNVYKAFYNNVTLSPIYIELNTCSRKTLTKPFSGCVRICGGCYFYKRRHPSAIARHPSINLENDGSQAPYAPTLGITTEHGTQEKKV